MKINPEAARLAFAAPGDEIVISGVSGAFPGSENVAEYAENLYNEIDMVSSKRVRYNTDHPDVPKRCGNIGRIDQFDNIYFNVTPREANFMDPISRMLLEKTLEAVVDAGEHPDKLRGSNCGVFIGAFFVEGGQKIPDKNRDENMIQTPQAIFSNQISYHFGCTGPSYTIDVACSSSIYALDLAFRAIRDGLIDSAIVGAANLCLTTNVTLEFSRLWVLSLDGKCKVFDESANGYTRSESVSVIYLQKMKDAKRNYGTVVYTKTNSDGFKPQGITYPSGKIQEQLLTEFYSECGIAPSSMAYIEAHGTGTRVGDPEEANTIDKIFTPGRTTPLKVGTVKSNIGHTEPASGIASITKVILAFETGIIPPNLHYKNPRKDIIGLLEGRLEVITEKTPLEGDLVPVNSFGFGGANAHTLLRRNHRKKINQGIPDDDVPRLVVVSGRTAEAVTSILDDLEKRSMDAEYVALLHSVFSKPFNAHHHVGYAILQKGARPVLTKEVAQIPLGKKPLILAFGGLSTEWSKLGSSLLIIPAFAEAITKCNAALKPHGIDIFKILSADKTDTLSSLIRSAAIQIGLVDILKVLEIVPDYIIGYSLGELGCAYADGCLTAEETILATYSVGVSLTEAKLPKVAMVELGIGSDQINCPKGIDVACHNNSRSCTISGPVKKIKKFVDELTIDGTRSKIVNDLPYHTRSMGNVSQLCLQEMKKVIPIPKLRSPKWISTSVPIDVDFGKHCSAEYFISNLVSPVEFSKVFQRIPKEANAIEIGALRGYLPATITSIPLTQVNTDSTIFLLEAIGKLYFKRLQPQLGKLYPAIQFPVSLGTPMISSLIKWDHSAEWVTPITKQKRKTNTLLEGERRVTINIKETSDFKYVRGHMIDGRVLYPATGYLFLVWETFSIMHYTMHEEVAVVFENIKFIRSTNVPNESDVKLLITIQKGTGQFEVMESNATVVTGNIRCVKNSSMEFLPLDPLEPPSRDTIQLQKRDVYKELRLRGYNYEDEFRGILECDLTATSAKIDWMDNWTAFMDAMLQLQILHEDSRNLYVPTSIQKLTIDPKLHPKYFIDSEDRFSDLMEYYKQGIEQRRFHVNAFLYKDLRVIRAGGVEVRGLQANSIVRRRPLGDPVLERQIFVPFKYEEQLSVTNALRLCVQLALDNAPAVKVKVVEIGSEASLPLAESLLNVLQDLPLIVPDYTIISNQELNVPNKVVVEDKSISSESNAMFVIASNLSTRPEILAESHPILKDNGYIISRENLDEEIGNFENYRILTEVCTETDKLVMLRSDQKIRRKVSYIKIFNDPKFSWLEEVKRSVHAQPTILYTENEPLSGLIGFVNCIRKEPGGGNTRAFFMIDPKAPPFDPELPFYKTQIDQGLAINIYQDGKWGHYRHLELDGNTQVQTKQAYVDILTRGDLSTMVWLQGPESPKIKYADVYYSSLNFRDVMFATGKLSADVFKMDQYNPQSLQGFEFSGRDAEGNRVMGMIPFGALATRVPLNHSMLCKIPDHWSLADAATIPAVYATVYYALIAKGNLQPGQSILIHAGSGGVGQAAINVALFYKCNIFTTVGTQAKLDFIRETFPQIPESHIGNSRDTSFEQMVMQQTNGKGVDFVLNSLAEEKLQASLRCLGEGGAFLEIGKFDLSKDTQLGMKLFMRGVRFYAVLFDNVLHPESPPEMAHILNGLIQKGIEEGAVKPLVKTVFRADEVEQAYRYMAAGNHIGKVLINLRPEEPEKSFIPKPLSVRAIPRVYFNPECSYVIVGGLGGFGLELAYWMFTRGARKIVLSSRNGITKGYQALRIKRWRDYRIEVKISTADITTVEGCTALLHSAKLMGQVEGIFNLSVVLRDAILENQSVANFKVSYDGKVYGTRNLDTISRKMCPNLKHFVVFSSVSCGRGNAGQTNYGMANCVMERICEKRVSEGLPGLAIQWGAIGEVGLVADMSESSLLLEIGGTLQQSLRSCLQVMDTFLNQDSPVVSSMVVAEKKSGAGSSDNVVDCVANILGIRDLGTVSFHATLAEMGMDSMMAVEIKQILEREFEVYLTSEDIQKLTLHKLHEIQKSLESEEDLDVNTNEDDGIGGLIRTLGDENLSEQILVKMPSLDTIDTPLFLIAGVEGNCTVFNSLSSQLHPVTYVLQTGTQVKAESLDLIVEQLFMNVISNISLNQEFKIAAYSYGSLIAIGLVLKLEAAGYQGKLLLIDGSPSFLSVLCQRRIATGATDSDIQVSLLLTIMKNFAPVNLGSFKTELKATKTWKEKVELLVAKVPSDIKNYSPQYQTEWCDVMLARLRSLVNYKIDYSKKLKAPLMLIRPQLSLVSKIAEDYDLSRYTGKPVPVTFIEGDHFTIIDHPQLVEVMNNFFK